MLNAKHHEREAEIVAQAGRKGAVTISTNMAGRGTDIILGGNPEMMAKREVPGEEPAPPEGETEDVRRAGSRGPRSSPRRRVQARDRGAARGGRRARRPAHPRHRAPRVAPHRQPAARPRRPPGRPGLVAFYLSLEDDLMRIFAGERITG